ncbi:MAG: nickel pincer cofactor biosynthesis protein LarC [Desulfobulbaceae bacterium]|nr:nickel pincer cofactor biosynthesis protein LarC [Desulfobulbaceae bacterium]
MKIVYADCFSGISGDMLLGALLHCGIDQEFLRNELNKLALGEFEFLVEEKTIQSISSCKVTVCSQRRQELRTLPALMEILNRSGLDDAISTRSAEVFRTLAEAEAKVHGIAVEKVHFHEVGALDTIVDVVGTIIALHQMGAQKLISSPLPMGRGFVNCAHGRLPLPAPAVCELLRDIPVYGVEIQQELVTPTGAALIKTLAEEFGPMIPMTVSATGYGAGSHVLPDDQPNLLRLITGYAQQVDESQIIEVIETNLDDWSPETFPFLCDHLFTKGALDVSLTSILMKKGRPGFTLQVICSPVHALDMKNIILTETSAIGLRFRKEDRQTLAREEVTLTTTWGEIKAKKVQTPSGPVIYPEYEECKKIAVHHHIPLQEVYNEVRCRQKESE